MLSVAFNPSRPLILATGGQDDRAFLLAISEDEKPSITSIALTGHQDSVCCVGFNSTGEYLATCDMNGVIKIWNTRNGELVKSLEGPEEPEWIRWHNKTNVLFASGNDFSIWSWSLPGGVVLPVSSRRRYKVDVDWTYGHSDLCRYESFRSSKSEVMNVM